jgi:hypothetical protein
MSTAALAEIQPDQITIDPQPCDLCGCTIEDVEELIYLRADDLIAQWERSDLRDCWRHTGEQPPRAVERARAAAQPYRTPQSTIDAFWYVVDLALMRRIDELHLEYPFAGSRMLRDFLNREGLSVGRRHVGTLMKRMGIEAIYRRPKLFRQPGPALSMSPRRTAGQLCVNAGNRGGDRTLRGQDERRVACKFSS